MDTNTKSEINFLIKPGGILLAIILLLVVTVAIGINQISELRTKIVANQKIQKTLEQKVSTLQTVSDILSGDVTFLDIVLPSKGGVLYGLSQVKNLALNYQIGISSIKAGLSVPEGNGIYKNSISFEVEGEEQNIYNFLLAFGKVLPLMNVDKVSLNKSQGLTQASISVAVYSAELPKNISAVTEAVKDLTTQEKDLLEEISTYTLPQFIEPYASKNESTRTDPF